MIRKLAAIMLVALAAALVAQPASAGVGGCRIPGVGGCGPGGGLLVSNEPTTGTPSVLDLFAGFVRGDMLAFAKAALEQKKAEKQQIRDGQTYDQGVGGCRIPGVGGCVL